MARLSDFAPGNRLHCGAKDHPANVSRDTMYFLEDKGGFFVFACRLCTEIQRRLQIHVLTKSTRAVEIYKHTRKAEFVDRDKQGRIISFR